MLAGDGLLPSFPRASSRHPVRLLPVILVRRHGNPLPRTSAMLRLTPSPGDGRRWSLPSFSCVDTGIHSRGLGHSQRMHDQRQAGSPPRGGKGPHDRAVRSPPRALTGAWMPALAGMTTRRHDERRRLRGSRLCGMTEGATWRSGRPGRRARKMRRPRRSRACRRQCRRARWRPTTTAGRRCRRGRAMKDPQRTHRRSPALRHAGRVWRSPR